MRDDELQHRIPLPPWCLCLSSAVSFSLLFSYLAVVILAARIGCSRTIVLFPLVEDIECLVSEHVRFKVRMTPNGDGDGRYDRERMRLELITLKKRRQKRIN